MHHPTAILALYSVAHLGVHLNGCFVGGTHEQVHIVAVVHARGDVLQAVHQLGCQPLPPVQRRRRHPNMRQLMCANPSCEYCSTSKSARIWDLQQTQAVHDNVTNMRLCAPEFGRNSDCRHMSMPPLVDALRFAQHVAHALPPGALRHQTVLRPLCQVLEVKRQVVLQKQASGRCQLGWSILGVLASHVMP